MADFIDKMKNGLNKGVATISTGSKTMLEKTKINSIINNLENEKKQMCESMGNRVFLYYTQNPEADFPNGEMIAFCQDMQQHNAQIEEQKAKLVALDEEMNKVLGNQPPVGQIVCPCGYANAPGAKFCARCGNKLGNF